MQISNFILSIATVSVALGSLPAMANLTSDDLKPIRMGEVYKAADEVLNAVVATDFVDCQKHDTFQTNYFAILEKDGKTVNLRPLLETSLTNVAVNPNDPTQLQLVSRGRGPTDRDDVFVKLTQDRKKVESITYVRSDGSYVNFGTDKEPDYTWLPAKVVSTMTCTAVK